MMHETNITAVFKTLFLHYVKQHSSEGNVQFTVVGTDQDTEPDWIIRMKIRLSLPDTRDFVLFADLFHNVTDPDEPRLTITYSVTWNDEWFDSVGKEAEDYLLEILDWTSELTVTLQDDKSYLFEHQFDILEDGHFSQKLFEFEREEDLPVELLLDNDEIVEPFMRETNHFFFSIHKELHTVLNTLYIFMRENRENAYAEYPFYFDGIWYAERDPELPMAKKETRFAQAILAELRELDSESDPSYEQKIDEAIRKIEQTMRHGNKNRYLRILNSMLAQAHNDAIHFTRVE